MPPVVAERMSQMHDASAVCNDVSGPVPAVRRLYDHVGVLAGLRQLGGQGERVIVDAHCLERLAGASTPHDHAASSMQIDADILLKLLHGSLLPFPGWFGDPKCASHTWSRSTGGLPRRLRLRATGFGDDASCHRTAPR